MNTPCQGMTGLIFGHKFVPRYNLSSPTLTRISADCMSADELKEIFDTTKAKTYIGDCCARCGEFRAPPH